jgi:regulator of RNase E activity RraA
MLGVEPLDPQVTEFLSGVSTATLTAELFTHGLRNTFLSGVRSLNPAAARFVGDAFTLRYIPAREDLDVVDGFADPEHPQRRAIENLSSGRVLVVDCRGDMGAGALGNILVTRMMRRGAVALVTDGSVRDSHLIANMDFPVFCAGGAAPLSLTIHHPVDFQPSVVAGLLCFQETSSWATRKESSQSPVTSHR